MALIRCPECARSVSDQARTCPSCGYPLRGDVEDRQSYNYPPAIPAKSRSIAILLAIFLGGFGIHKFYLNKPGQGVLYLLFCWTFIPAIAGLIEAIIYLCHDDRSFQQKYIK
ncbi:MAG: TM2 domain-containing protein [Syntrophobacteraceae bacterium]